MLNNKLMKAEIIKTSYIKERETKFGIMHLHKIIFINEDLQQIEALYNSKKKEQTYFIEGKEAEFTCEIIKGKDNKKDFYVVKPIGSNYQSSGGRAIKKEQSRYSGFAVSYVKDLIVAEKIPIEDWKKESKVIFDFMVSLDKSLDS